MKIQATLETAILFALSLLLIVGFISYAVIVNNHNLQYETTPFVLSSLKFYNFQTIGSTCSFDFEFQTNAYLPYPNYELTFILNNGQKIVPDYNIYTETVTPVLSNGYQYTFVLNGVPNYNGSVCSIIGQQSVNHAYVKYVSYKNANGKTIVQSVSTNYVFQINSASTIPNQLYNNNTIFITGSVIPYSGYVYINYQNGTAVSGSPFTLGEYVYLPTGNYSLSYTNESNPVSFQYWSSSGGVIIQNTFDANTNMIVINNGEIYLNLRNLLKPSQTFIIYSNKTYSTIPGKFNITANFSKNGFYTYYVNNKPYTGCENVSQTSCIMSFSTAGTYTISATFKNSTTFAEATPIKLYVFNPLSATLSSNETVAQNKTNVMLSVSTNGGLQPFTYSFYVNNAPIQNCIDISTPTCTYNIDNPPNDYVYNYTFIANVSDSVGELVTTNNVVVEGIVAIPIILYNSQNQATPTPFQQMIQINETQTPFKNIILYNKTFANFEFIYQNETVIPAWIESNQSGKLTIWVKLAKSIPADSSTTIYLESAGSKNLLSSSGTTGIGEAPQLSPVYGEYDDGSSIFSLYSNFYDTLAGYSSKTLCGSFAPIPTTSPYDSVELMNNAGGTGSYILSPTILNPGDYILQTYWSYSGQADSFDISLWGNPSTIYDGGGGCSPGMDNGLTYHYEFWQGGGGTAPSGNPNGDFVYSLTNNYAGPLILSTSASGEGTYYVYSQIAFYNIGSNSGTVAIYSSSATSTSIANNIEPAELYNPTYQASASFSSISLSASPILFGAGTGGAESYVYIYWALIRAYPPNGVMPSVTIK